MIVQEKSKEIRPDEIYNVLKSLQEMRPLIHCISNIITANFCANGLLALGCSPVMAHHPAEVGEITSRAAALSLNMGALEDFEAMKLAAAKASEMGHPIVIDPVGVAASSYRRERCFELMDTAMPTCIRGNKSEILALLENRFTAGGVDARVDAKDIPGPEDFIKKMQQFAGEKHLILVASGKEDIVTDGTETYLVANGDPMMAKITGSGCLSGAVLSAVLYLNKSARMAAIACGIMGIAGQKAAGLTKELEAGTMTFEKYFIDSLSLLGLSDCEIINVSRLP